jgi:imidazolonepropionase-like amidohydrolase
MKRTLLTGATIIDGTGAEPAEADVVIEEGLISEVGPGLDGDEAIDLSGRWLLPGIVDCHVHVMISTINMLKMMQTPFSLNFYLAARNLEETLRSGVTTVRDAGGADLGVKRAVEDGLIKGPRMKIAVTILSQTGGHADGWFTCGAEMPFFIEHPGRPATTCDGPEGVLRRVREVIRAGADVIKICTTGGVLSPEDEPTSSQFLPEEIEVIVAEARAADLEVMSHAQGTDGIKNAVRAGVRSIEHGIYLDDEAIEMMLDAGTFLVPTLIAPMGVLENPDGVPEAGLRKAREVGEVHRDSISRAAAAGVKIAMGTDSGITAHGRNLEELIHMVEVGMSPMDAIVASTKVAAENLGVSDEAGTIEPQKRADLLALAGDPVADVKVFGNRDHVVGVWLGGEQILFSDQS